MGKVERWVDAVHIEEHSGDPRAMTTGLGERVTHAIRCLVVYARVVIRPARRAHEKKVAEVTRRRKALWKICALLVREYKQSRQEDILRTRKRGREGLVCGNTRNVGRLGPKGGVMYDETRRYRQRIGTTEEYKLKRWPRRDKGGPTLVGALHYIWGIT